MKMPCTLLMIILACTSPLFGQTNKAGVGAGATGAGAADAGAGQPAEDWITLISDSEEASANGRLEARFPLNLKVDANNVSISVVDLFLKGKRVPQTAKTITAEIETPEGHVPALLVQSSTVTKQPLVQRDKVILPPGDYRLALNAKAAGQKPKDITIQLTIPAAKIDVTSPYKMELSQCFFGFPAKPHIVPRLTIRETSGNSTLDNINIDQTSISGPENKPVSGFISAKNIISPTSPSRQWTAELVPEEAFPLGSTTGTLEISAIQMSEPVKINFEVTTRVAIWTLWAVIVGGILTGWLVRTKLQNAIDTTKASQDAVNIQKEIDRLRKQFHDYEFNRTLNGISGALETTVQTGDAAAIRTACDNARTKLTEAAKKLTEIRNEAIKELNAMIDTVELHWNLPAQVTEILESADSALQETKKQFDAGYVSDANRNLETLRKKLSESVTEQVRLWKDSTLACFDSLCDECDFLSKEVIDPLKNEAKTSLGSVSELTPAATAAAIKEFVDQLGPITLKINAGLKQLGSRIQQVVDQMRIAMGAVSMPDPAPTEEFYKKAAALVQSIPELINNSQASCTTVLQKLQEMKSACREALTRQLAGRTEPEKKQVDDLLREGKYQEAAVKVVELLIGKPAGAVDRIQQPGMRPEVLSGGVLVVPETPRKIGMYISSGIQLNLLERETALKRSLFWYSTLQSAFLLILITFVGVILYSDTYIGTLKEVGKVFFWAFSLDITSGTLLSAVAEIRK